MFCEKCGIPFKNEDVCPICSETASQDSALCRAIDQLKAGDNAGFSVVYQHTHAYVRARAKAFFDNREDIADVVQDVYVTLYCNIRSLQSNESLFAWLRTITFRASARVLSKKKNEFLLAEDEEAWLESIPDDSFDTEADFARKEDVELLHACIARLSDIHRSVIIAYYFDNLTIEEIAELLSISLGTVKSRLFLARKKLKQYIEEQEGIRGYKLHSVTPMSLLLAIRLFLQKNASSTENTIVSEYNNVCAELGIPVTAKDALTIAPQVGKRSRARKDVSTIYYRDRVDA